MAVIGTHPLEVKLVVGEEILGTATIGIPLEAGELLTNEDGKQYVEVTPVITQETVRQSLLNALAEEAE